MCQATAYLDGERIMEDVIWVEPTAEGILLRTLFGEARVIAGTLEGVDLLKHRVLLAPKGGQQQASRIEGGKA